MVEPHIKRKLALFLVTALWSGNVFLLPAPVKAETTLTRAVIQSLRNSVRLLLQSQPPRPARVRDAMTPGDSISTARAARAELRFNDGSLARLGERALFRFLPNTRTFQLNNGTVLLLIPRGRGQTQIRTPNVVTGVRGSALFVRYLPESDTTLVGALTTSGIEVSNRDRTQQQPLQAGQMAVVVQNRIDRVLNFDLRTFYETSSLVSGLNLSGREPSTPLDADLAVVQEETVTALNAQDPVTVSETDQNSTFPGSAGTSANRSQSQSSNQSGTSSVAPITPIDTTILRPTTDNQPIKSPPTEIVGQPSDPPGRNVGRGTLTAPGQTGTAPGLAGTTPGRGTSTAPGRTGITPGQLGNNSGRGNVLAPGQAGTAPGLAGTTPGQSNSGPPGQAGTAPGLAGTTPGQSNSAPPGQAGTAPGLAGTTPGQSNSAPPGKSGAAPGQSGNNPGRGN